MQAEQDADMEALKPDDFLVSEGLTLEPFRPQDNTNSFHKYM
jgi:hypothetical protein